MFAVEVWGGKVGDEELAAVGAGACVGHREDAGFVVFEVRDEFVAEFVAWAARSGAGWVAALNHEVGDDAVEFDVVVVVFFGEVEVVRDGHGGLGSEEGGFDVAFFGVEDDADVGHKRVCEVGFSPGAGGAMLHGFEGEINRRVLGGGRF